MEITDTAYFLRKRYILTLVLLGLFFVGSFLHEYLSLQKIKQFSNAIDRAGFMRKQVYETALYVSALRIAQDKTTQVTLAEDIQNSLRNFKMNRDLFLGNISYFNRTITHLMRNHLLDDNKKNYHIIENYVNKINALMQEAQLRNLPVNLFIEQLNQTTKTAALVFHDGVLALDQKMIETIRFQLWIQFLYLILFLIGLLLLLLFVYFPVEHLLVTHEQKLLDKIKASLEKAEYSEESYGRYIYLLQHAPVGITVFDVGKGVFIDANAKASEMLNYKQNQLIGLSPADISPEKQPDGTPSNEAAADVIAKVKKKGSATFEWTYQCSDGRNIPCLVNLNLIQAENKRYMQGVFVDISVQKELQAALLETNKLLIEANSAKLKFLSVMSHELRTPLNSILGYTEMLKDGMAGEVNEEQHDYLNEVHQNGQQLLQLINDVLDLSKFRSGNKDLQLEKVNMQSLIEECLLHIRGYQNNKKLQWETDFQAVKNEIVIDPQKIKQVIQNLLSNAIKFTPEGGKISIQTENTKDYYLIKVIDTGIGIPAATIKQLFEPFIQADNSLTRESGGTGLGLAITKEIVEMHHGEVSVQSKEGEGSCFMVKLPFKEAQDEQANLDS